MDIPCCLSGGGPLVCGGLCLWRSRAVSLEVGENWSQLICHLSFVNVNKYRAGRQLVYRLSFVNINKFRHCSG